MGEKKTVARITTHGLENNGGLPNTEGGCRPGRNTTMNAAIMAYEVYEGFQKKDETFLVTLDPGDS